MALAILRRGRIRQVFRRIPVKFGLAHLAAEKVALALVIGMKGGVFSGFRDIDLLAHYRAETGMRIADHRGVLVL